MEPLQAEDGANASEGGRYQVGFKQYCEIPYLPFDQGDVLVLLCMEM